jgi:hypothetical protein
MKTCNASRVIEPSTLLAKCWVRSANLVGETKVDRGNQSFPQMCVRRGGERINPEAFRGKSPLMPLAQKATHYDTFTLQGEAISRSPECPA